MNILIHIKHSETHAQMSAHAHTAKDIQKEATLVQKVSFKDKFSRPRRTLKKRQHWSEKLVLKTSFQGQEGHCKKATLVWKVKF